MAIVKSVLVNNPSSAGAVMNQIAILGATFTTITAINVVTTADQYQYEVSISGT